MSNQKKYVYFFGAGQTEGNAEMKEILGGKGANLADFITAEKITGMAPYGHGEESRPNDLTWVATMNGGNVDTDMATRTYKLKIRKPTTYAPRWEQETRALIAANGPQILADIAHMMANSTERERHGYLRVRAFTLGEADETIFSQPIMLT